ncbi:MAG: bacteriohemerythrin [Deltaproteobacteria bacterium]|nr:bacteriohemerythrin [Deltaproteobacteria bacterium]
MSFFVEWNDYLKVNVSILDEQNRKLTMLANKTYNALLKKQTNPAFEEKVLQALFDYAKDHFIIEEELMMKNGYDGLKPHKDEHNNYTTGLVEIFQKHQAGIPVSGPILDLLKDWLKNHVLKKDKELGIFLNSRGIY